MNAKAPRVTVIMRAKNSDWVIGQALAALYAQDYHDFELLVVDSGSTDRTLDIVRQYPCRLIKIEPKAYFPGTVLNDAIAHARGEILVFQNSDAVPLAPDVLRKLVAAVEQPDTSAAFVRQIPRPDAHSWVRRDYAVAFPEQGAAPDWQPLSLVMSAMRRSAWEEHPFYTDAWGSEDTEWGVWARSAGKKIRYVPDAVIMHSHNYTLRQIYGRRFIEGEADAYIYGDTDSPVKTVKRFVSSLARDMVWHLRTGDLAGGISMPARRAVYQWAYYQGHRHGEARIARRDTDAGKGQSIVLERHESNKNAAQGHGKLS